MYRIVYTFQPPYEENPWELATYFESADSMSLVYPHFVNHPNYTDVGAEKRIKGHWVPTNEFQKFLPNQE